MRTLPESYIGEDLISIHTVLYTISKVINLYKAFTFRLQSTFKMLPWRSCQTSSRARALVVGARRTMVTGKHDVDEGDPLYSKNRVNAMVGYNFPDYIEWWNRNNFRRVGYGLSMATALSVVGPAVSIGVTNPVTFVPAVVLGAFTAGYWRVGLADMKQSSHAIRRNYPVLGNLRYILETVSLIYSVGFESGCHAM
jgi:hypothetical protein